MTSKVLPATPRQLKLAALMPRGLLKNLRENSRQFEARMSNNLDRTRLANMQRALKLAEIGEVGPALLPLRWTRSRTSNGRMTELLDMGQYLHAVFTVTCWEGGSPHLQVAASA